MKEIINRVCARELAPIAMLVIGASINLVLFVRAASTGDNAGAVINLIAAAVLLAAAVYVEAHK